MPYTDLPCPFCGREGLHQYEDEHYYIRCSNRFCDNITEMCDSEEEAVNWWNRKAGAPPDNWRPRE
jgi:hypothetical protein